MTKLLLTVHTIANGRTKLIWAFALAAFLATAIGVASPNLLWAQSEPTLNLSSLSITDQNGTAIDLGTFDPTVLAYSANVASTAESVTVSATAESGKDAYIYISPGNYILPGTSDTTASHQVDLSHGTNTILISVHSFKITEPLKTYTLLVSRSGEAPSDSPTAISVSGLGWARKGSTIPFLFTRTGDTSQSLTVPVDVSETRRKVRPSQEGRHEVTFPSGQASVRLDIQTVGETDYYTLGWGDSRLELALVDGAGFEVNPDASTANAWVWEHKDHFVTSPNLTFANQDGTSLSSHGSVDVETNTEWVTVTISGNAWGEFGTSYVLPPDSRPNVSGHQVDLNYGANLITASFASQDREEVLTTRQVTINRPGSSSGSQTPSVSIYGPPNGREGERIPFLLTRMGDVSQALTVSLDVSETGGDVVPSFLEGRFSVDFEAGYATARYDLWTDGDSYWEDHSVVSIVLMDEDSYDVNSQYQSVSLTTADNDVPDMTATLTLDSLEAAEGEEITATVTVVTDGPKQPHGSDAGQLRVMLVPGTVEYGEAEYAQPGQGTFWVGPNFESVIEDGVVTAYKQQKSILIWIVDDERPEPDETFEVVLQVDDRYSTWYPRGGTFSIEKDSNSFTVTVPGIDEVPKSPEPVGFVKAVVTDHGSSGSAFTITWEDAGQCPNWYEADLFVDTGYLSSIPVKHFIGTSYGGQTEISGTVDNTEVINDNTSSFVSYYVQVTCIGGFDPISEVEIEKKSWDVPDAPVDLDTLQLFGYANETKGHKPLPGTYSSEPPLTGLTVTPGTLQPTFDKNGFLYAALDVPNGSDQTTLNATANPGYTISWNPSEDADPDTDGHQVDLEVGYNSIFVTVADHPFLNSFTYEVIVKRAEANDQNSPATGSPTISGMAQVGQTLTASTTRIADTDGLTNASYTYQWIAHDGTSDSYIADATASTYTLVDEEAGKTIKVKVTFTDDGGNEEALTSAATAAVAATVPDAPGSLSVSVNDTGKLDVSWDAPASNGGSTVTGYRVQWKESSDSWETPADVSVTTVTGTRHTVTGLTDGAEYTFRVFAFNTVGDSSASEEGSGTPRETTAPTVSSATVDGATLTLTFSEGLTETPLSPMARTFKVNVGDNLRWVAYIAISGSTVTLTLGSAVTSSDQVSVSYKVSDNTVAPRLKDLSDNSVESFTGQAVTNNTAAAQTPLTASIHDEATSHDGQEEFTFELRFSENLEGFSYKTLRDHAFTVTGGKVEGARRLTPPSNTKWQIKILPTSNGDVTIVLPITTDCADNGAVCNGDSRKLSNRLELTVSGPGSQQSSQQQEENSPATGNPTISGTAQVGETLTASTTGITDADRLTNVSYSYQWIANDGTSDSDIADATASAYTLVAADAGKTIKVKVAFTDDNGNDESLTSTATTAVIAANTSATGAPTISGTVQVDQTLTADTSGIGDADGLTNVSYSYQWIANDGTEDTDIQDATGSTYILSAADEGKTVKVRVSFTDDEGNQETRTSALTVAVAPIPNSPATGEPTISGTAQVGQMLTASTSDISDSNGLANAIFTYQWIANDGTEDTDIQDATGSTYILSAADEGKTVKVRVSFTDDEGNQETRTSNLTAAAVAAAPSPLTAAIHNAPDSHNGSNSFTFELHFSEEPESGFSYKTLRDDAFTITAGSVAGARRLNQDSDTRNTSWEIRVKPDSGANVTVELPVTQDCEADGAICTDDGRMLSSPLKVTVQGVPLTAAFESFPTSHDGSETFKFSIALSEEPETGFGYKTMRDDAFTVEGGTVVGARRLESGKNQRWEISVSPDSGGDVEITLPATTDCDAGGAICTGDGRPLSNRLEITVSGPSG